MKKKEEIFQETILKNIERKSVFVDKVQIADGKPLFSWIDLNITELCNRKCAFCPRSNNNVYPNQNLNISVSLCKKIADELRSLNYEGAVVLSGYGEPMLHPNLIEIVKILGAGIHLEMITNGDSLNTMIVKKLFENGLDVIVVSMYDGPHQIEHFENIFNESGIDKSCYILRDRWYDIEEDYGVKLTNRAGMVSIGNQAEVDQTRPCHYPFYSMMIDWNGDVMLCVQDWNKKVKMGNISLNPILSVWHSTNFSKYRYVLGKGERCLSPCINCNTNGTLHGKNHLEIWNSLKNHTKV